MMTRTATFLLFFLFLTGILQAGAQSQGRNRRLDSLVRMCREPKDDTLFIKRLLVLSDELWRVGRNDTTLICLDDVFTRIQRVMDAAGDKPASDTAVIMRSLRRSLGNSFNIRGTVNANTGKMNEAFRDHETARHYFEVTGDQDGLAKSYINLGEDSRKLGNYPQALQHYLAALRIVVKTGNKTGIAYSYNNIGAVYFYQKNFPEALKNFKAALEIRRQIGDRNGISYSLNNVALVQVEMKQYEDALHNYLASLGIKKETGDLPAQSSTYLNIGDVYLRQKKYDLAIVNFLTSVKIRTQTGQKAGLADCYNNLGAAYLLKGRPGDADEYFKKALALGLETHSKEGIKDSYWHLSQSDSARKDYKQALGHYKLYVTYNDSLVNEENTKKTVQAQMQYEFDKKESDTKAEQEKKDAVAAADARRQRIILFSVAGCLLLVAVFAVFIFRSYRQKQAANIEITRQKHLIEEKQKEILDSIYYARRIQRSLLPSEKYLARHTHGLKTGKDQ